MLQPNPVYMWYVCDIYMCEKLMFFAGEPPGEFTSSHDASRAVGRLLTPWMRVCTKAGIEAWEVDSWPDDERVQKLPEPKKKEEE